MVSGAAERRRGNGGRAPFSAAAARGRATRGARDTRLQAVTRLLGHAARMKGRGARASRAPGADLALAAAPCDSLRAADVADTSVARLRPLSTPKSDPWPPLCPPAVRRATLLLARARCAAAPPLRAQWRQPHSQVRAASALRRSARSLRRVRGTEPCRVLFCGPSRRRQRRAAPRDAARGCVPRARHARQSRAGVDLRGLRALWAPQLAGRALTRDAAALAHRRRPGRRARAARRARRHRG